MTQNRPGKVWQRGHTFEEFEIGKEFQHHWGKTITAGENALFTTSMLAFCPLYTNADYARKNGHKDVVVYPMLVFITVFGMSVEDLSEGGGTGGAFLGYDKLRFLAPVYPGDTLYGDSTVLSTRLSGSRPDFGIVSWNTVGTNQRGEKVVTFERTNMVGTKAAIQ